jgi:murein hydrolase activator
MRYILLLFFFWILFFFPTYGQTRAELEKQRLSMLNEISETENILSNVKKNRSESLEALELIDRKIETRNKLISNISNDISKVDIIIKDIESQVGTLNGDILTIKKEYARVLWLSYLNRQKLNQWMYILSANDMNQAYRRMKYLKQYADYRKRQVKAIQNIQTDLGKKIVELDKQKNEKSILLSKAESEKKLLNNEIANKTDIVNSLKKREKELSAKIKESNKLAEKIKSEIENLIRKEIAENKARMAREAKANAKIAKRAKSLKVTKSVNTEKVNTPIPILSTDDAALSSSFKENKGKLPWPTEKGIITGYFGERNHPVYKNVILRNNGIDISTVEGATVHSIFEGEVRCIIPILGANYSVLVRHGNYYTVYTNIIDVRVKAGDKVKTKQTLGKVFTDNTSNATILHVEVWENLNRLDPQLWLNKN